MIRNYQVGQQEFEFQRGVWSHRTKDLLPQRFEQLGNCPVQIHIGAALGCDLFDRAQDRGVMFAAELPADLGKRRRSELFDQIHRHLAGEGDGLRALRQLQVGREHAKVLPHAFLDHLNRRERMAQVDDFPSMLGVRSPDCA